MKTYFTFLERNKLFTFVNVAGLSISLMFVLLIANMVTRQLTVDKDLPDADRIYICPMPTASMYLPTNTGQEDITTWATACKAAIPR